jgi:hypothetical protein
MEDEVEGACNMHWGDLEMRTTGKIKEKRILKRSRHTWDDYIKMGLKKTGCEGMDWINVAQDKD